MRSLVIAVALAALAWSGYWAYGSRATSAAVRGWLAERSADGWVAEAAGVETRGFPNRFDTTLTAPRLALPGGGAGWSAPFLQILRLSYKTEHAIVIFPDSQRVSLAGETIAIASARMQASAVFSRGLAPALDRTNLVAEGLALSLAGGAWTVAETLAALRRAPATTTGYDLALELRDIGGRGGAIRLDRASLDATATLAAPLDGATLEAAALGIESLEIRRLSLLAGALELTASGTLTFDRTGLPSGRLTLQSDNWVMVSRLVESLNLALPIVPSEIAGALHIVIERGAVSLLPD